MPDAYAAGPGGQSVAAAAEWIEMLLTGRLATVIAVLAVAFLGYGMLYGRVSQRRALQVVLGCFVLFGSSAIAHSLIEATSEPVSSSVPATEYVLPPPLPPPADRAPANGNPFDPYSGTKSPR